MRDLVLNHASLRASAWRDTVESLPDLGAGIALLVKTGTASRVLRMSQSPHELLLPGNRSLFEAFQECRQRGWRDLYVFLMSLSTRIPVEVGLAADIVDRLLTCETRELRGEDGGPLLVCALTDSIAVSLASDPIWDRDQLEVGFLELLRDDSWNRVSEIVDNIARSVHANVIISRDRRHLHQQCSEATDLWEQRAEMFPHLLFGPEVSGHIAKLNTGLLRTLVNRLADLDETASAWGEDRGAIPPWRCKVTPESKSLMDHPKRRRARYFKSVYGQRQLFEWHARFGRGGRIHLRFDPQTQEIEVGYVGMHLPL